MNDKELLKQIKIIAAELSAIRQIMQSKRHLYCDDCVCMRTSEKDAERLIERINTIADDKKLDEILGLVKDIRVNQLKEGIKNV